MTVIRAELRGSNRALAAGIVAVGSSPVLALCRRLVEAGHDPVTPLAAYRAGTLCLKVRSIGAAAALEVNGEGNGFRGLKRAGRSLAHKPKAVGGMRGRSAAGGHRI